MFTLKIKLTIVPTYATKKFAFHVPSSLNALTEPEVVSTLGADESTEIRLSSAMETVIEEPKSDTSYFVKEVEALAEGENEENILQENCLKMSSEAGTLDETAVQMVCKVESMKMYDDNRLSLIEHSQKANGLQGK